MADNRITRQRVKNHWVYSSWKYALMAICVIFGTNMFFTVTAYRPPEEKKVEVYLCSGWADTEAAQADLAAMMLEVDPEQEEMFVSNIDLTSSDYHAMMQFTTYMAAQQGDILLIPAAEYKKYASECVYDFYVNLEPAFEAGLITAPDVDYSNVTQNDASDEPGIFGIPADTLYGLLDYGIDPAGSVLVITTYSGNEDTCIGMLDAMVKRYQTEKPDFYDEWKADKQESATQIFY